MTAVDVAEDRNGMLWIATSNGVSLFNGKNIKQYRLPKSAQGFANRCFDIDIDRDGNVWVGTIVGVYRLMRYENEFVRMAEHIDNVESLVCAGEHVYVGNRSGLFRIGYDGSVKQIDFSKGQMNANNSVRNIHNDGDSVIWFTTRNDIYRQDLVGGQIARLPLQTPSGLSKIDKWGNSLYVGSKNNGLFKMDVATGKWEKIEGVGSVVTSLKVYGNTLFVGTDGSGAYEMDLNTDQVTAHYGMEEKGERQLPSNAVYGFGQNRHGCRWFGMFHKGFSYQYYTYPLFKTYSCGSFDSHGIHVSAHYSHGYTRLICTTDGFYITDEKAKTTTFHSTAQWGMRLTKHALWYNGYYYLGSYDTGLLRYNEKTGVTSRMPNCHKLDYATIGGLTISPEGKLWITTSEGIFIIDENDNIQNLNENNSKLPMGVKNTYFDTNGNGWMGTMHGLCIYLNNEKTIKDSEFPHGFFNTIPNLKTTGKGDEIVAWNMTRLFSTNATMSNFSEIRLPEGIVNESCEDVLPIGVGLYWLISERGLFHWNNKTRQVVHYGAYAGLTGNRISIHTLSLDNDNRLWVGTSNGLKYLDTSAASLEKGVVGSHVVADLVQVGDRMMATGETMEVNDKCELSVPWNLLPSRLLMTLAIADMSANKGRVYEYRLDNNDDWTIVFDDQSIALDRLSLGSHRLEVRLAGFASTATTFNIMVSPNVLFYFELALLAISAALFFYWRRWRKRTKVLLHEHTVTEQALIEEMEYATVKKEKENKDKYEKVKVADKELETLYARMNKYVAEKRPYLDKELKMSDIASVLCVSPSQLSQVFSMYVKESYYDYINRYRLEEFKRLVAEGNHKHYTVAALSEQCGFKRTSFFSTFRKMEGMTPTEWIQKYH